MTLRGTCAGAGGEYEDMRSPFLGRKERQRTCLMNWPQSHSLSPSFTWEREVENSGVKLSPGRREEWGEGALGFGFISRYPTLI